VGDLLTESSIKGIHQFVKIYKQKLEAYDFDQHELVKGLRGIVREREREREKMRESERERK
jgi:hypothetical protein